MTIFLTLLILILISISIWQVSKILELSQPKRVSTEIADDDDNETQGKLMFAFLIFIYVLTIFSFFKWGDVILPVSASEHGSEYDSLMWVTFSVIFFVQTVTQALLHYYGYKYRGVKGRKALFYADNDRLEAVWTIIPTIVLAVLILYGLYTWNDIMFIEGVFEFAQRDIIPGGSKRNLEYIDNKINFDDNLADFQKLMLADAQTSGGLLISCPEDRAEEFLKVLSWDMNAFKIGSIIEKNEKTILVR